MLTSAEKRELKAAVAKGARRLDARRPNWFHDVNTTILDLGDCTDCVCGQLYGGFDEDAVSTIVGGWVRKLISFRFNHVAAKYGLDVPHGFRWDRETNKVTEGYDYLTSQWKQAIYARRRAARRAEAA